MHIACFHFRLSSKLPQPPQIYVLSDAAFGEFCYIQMAPLALRHQEVPNKIHIDNVIILIDDMIIKILITLKTTE